MINLLTIYKSLSLNIINTHQQPLIKKAPSSDSTLLRTTPYLLLRTPLIHYPLRKLTPAVGHPCAILCSRFNFLWSPF